MMESILLTVDPRGVATLTLNREECHNAINRDCANLLNTNLQILDEDPEIRVVVITGSGISFSAGHDIAALRATLDAPLEALEHEAREYARLLATLDHLSKPTIARVQGAAFGLGVGLIACCDFAIASSDALFGFSEVHQGTISSTIAPYVIRAIGARAARRYFLSTERFNASKAKRLGLLHQDLQRAQLDRAVEQLAHQLLINGPLAMSATKQMVRQIEHRPIDETLIESLIQQSARTRASEEGREGVAAFIEHRKPQWVK